MEATSTQTSLFCDDPTLKKPGPYRRRSSPDEACAVDGCLSLSRVRGWCIPHYQQQHRITRNSRPCRASECSNKAMKGGLCDGHYKRQRLGKPIDDTPLDPRRHNASQARKCSVEGCQHSGPIGALSGLCQPHSYRLKRGLPLDLPVINRSHTKITPAILQATAEDRRGICLNPETYRNSNTQLRWKCELGHEWQAPWNGIKYGGSWCPHCSPDIGSSRSEKMCRRVIELMFKAPFPKAHPNWLKRLGKSGRGMELDGYCEPKAIAFEYQGDQHYDDQDHYGFFTAEKVAATIERDRLKFKRCWDHNVNLIVVPAFDDLNDVEGILRQVETSVTRAGLKEARNWKARRPTNIDQIWIPTDNPIRDAIQRTCDERGWECLSTYVDCKTNLLWKCSKGHTWSRTWNVAAKSTDCPTCRREARAGQICSVPDCSRKAATAKYGLCRGHKRRREKGQEINTPLLVFRRNSTPSCSAPDCQKPSHSHDLCTGHYHRWCKGQPMETPIKPLPPNRGKTIEDARVLATQKGGLCLSTSYSTAREHLLWQCAEGHRWHAAFGQVAGNKGTPGGTWCRKCYQIARRIPSDQICAVQECRKPVMCRGLCKTHYNKHIHGRRHSSQDTCLVDGCSRKIKSKQLCGLHYSRQYLGRPLIHRKDVRAPGLF